MKGGGELISVAIVDNEESERLYLQLLLRKYAESTGETFHISLFESGFLFLEQARIRNFELIFLDVDLPEMDGLETARKFRSINSSAVVIFVTNIARYAIHGYEVNALDYILKPLSYEAFFLKVPKAIAQCRRNRRNKVAIKTRNGQNVFLAASVIYVESDGHHLIYHTEQGDFPSYGTMKEVETMLPKENFFRCNSGYIVNLSFVTGCDGTILSLQGNIKIEISRARKKDFFQALQHYYFEGGPLT